jgi:hypothetical protein
MRRAFWGVLVLSVACAGSRGGRTGAGDAADVVTLRYAWPRDVKVTQTSEKLERNGDRPEKRQHIVYTLSLQGEGDDLIIRYEDPRDLRIPGASPDQAARLARVFGGMLPALVVSSEGSLEALRDTERVRAILERVTPRPPNLSPTVREALEYTRSDEGLLASAQGEWETRVGFWIGRRMKAGVTQTEVHQAPAPLGQGIAELNVEYRLDRVAPCPGAPKQACATLHLQSTPTEEDAKRWTRQILSSVVPDEAASIEVEKLERVITISVVAAVETLQTFEFRKVERTLVGLRMNGESMTQTRTQEISERYDWNPGSATP